MRNFFKTIGAAVIIISSQLGSAVAQEFYQATVTLDIINQEAKREIFGPLRNGNRERLEILPDNVFAKIDMKILIDEETSSSIKKMVDQGFTDEPSGCAPGNYGPLDMHQGLRYFLDVLDKNPNDIQFTVYPGNKINNWANSVYCEYDETLGEGMATVRLSGFYHVRHRNLENGLDVIFSAIPVSIDQVGNFVN